MNETLFTIDNTDNIVSYVRTQYKAYEKLNGNVSKDVVLHLIRQAVGMYETELKFHDRIRLVEKIYEEHFND